ncbi:MAG: hypothetical protein KatS3mg046_768 [Bellilinea sp.]|nr:MAG: hypothetical protein KatS3mg046_768 [Bellilinea sp.]
MADAAYGSEENYACLEQHHVENFLKYNTFYQDTHRYRNPQVLRAHQFRAEHFAYDPASDTFICPAGKRLHFQYTSRYTSDNGYQSQRHTYECFDCPECPLRSQCTRKIRISFRLLEYRRKARENLTSAEGQRLRAARSIEIETVFGQIKHNMAFRRFHLRGLEKVKTEWGLVSIAHNLRKLAARSTANFLLVKTALFDLFFLTKRAAWMFFPDSLFSLAWRTAVDIFPKMEEFLMNRSSPGTSKSKVSLSLAKAIDGFLKFKTAEGLSQRTITSYEFTLGHWLKYIGDREVSDIQSSDLTGYMAWLRTEYKPRRWNGSSEPLSAKSIRNVWVTFRSFFGWLQVEFKFPNPAKEITAPKFQKHPVETFTKEDVEKLLKACVYSRESQTEERKKFVMRRPSSNRDQTIVLMLLDTGLRATELCSLIINDVDLKTGKVTIRHGVAGGAKGVKDARCTWVRLHEKRFEMILQDPKPYDPAKPLVLEGTAFLPACFYRCRVNPPGYRSSIGVDQDSRQLRSSQKTCRLNIF